MFLLNHIFHFFYFNKIRKMNIKEKLFLLRKKHSKYIESIIFSCFSKEELYLLKVCLDSEITNLKIQEVLLNIDLDIHISAYLFNLNKTFENKINFFKEQYSIGFISLEEMNNQISLLNKDKKNLERITYGTTN